MQRLRRSETGKWPYAADSTGPYRGLLKQKYPCWVATGPARDRFTTEISDQLIFLLRNSLQESSSFMTLTLFMVGKVPQKTNPTIMVVSDDKARRKEAFEKIKASRILADYPGFELGHCEVAAEHEDLRQLGTGGSPGIHISSDEQPESLLACADTFGIPNSCFDGLPRPPSLPDDRAFDKSGSESDDCEITGLDGWDSDTDDEMLSSVTSHGSITSSSAGSDNEERLLGRKTSHQSPPSITTVPEEAFEQVPGTFEPSSAKGKGTAVHSLCVTLGPVMFLDAELDLVLIRVPIKSPEHEESLKRIPNVKPLNPHRYRDEDFWDREGAAGSSVTVLTASKGPISGKQSSMPFYTRLPGAHDFQMLHAFHLDIPLGAGDSGSWVVGGNDQELIGFVVAGSPKTGLCLVCPAKEAIRTFVYRLYQRSVGSIAGSASSPPLGPGGSRTTPGHWPGDFSGHSSQQSQDDRPKLQKQEAQHRPSTRSLMDQLMDPPSSYQEGEPRPVVTHRIVQYASPRPLMPDTRSWRVASLQEPVGVLQPRRLSTSPPSQSSPRSYSPTTGESSQVSTWGTGQALQNYDREADAWLEAQASSLGLDLDHLDDEDTMDID
ncbi:hypothetical protein PG993_004432 [Apiospora rasikravindrae]|uniref:Uncharacterized protein n=1 Tax=Apiospora rasikravindrae TaxID=990691 RepID=A0ABR1TCU5_9PEZI